MQLRKAKVVGALDNNGIGGRNIDTGFDNRGADQHVEALVMEVVHHPLQLTLAHLAVADGDTRLRYQVCQPLGGFLNILDVIVKVIHLPAAQHFAQDRLAHHQIVILAHEGFHRQSAISTGPACRSSPC
ncbi:2C-methyl-D-erythritol 2,4-cyclodiphosphate synthase(EC:4.6.1.12) [Cronobacter muytjensii 530]